MHPRAAELIDALGLRPHPEGGHCCEALRAALTQLAPSLQRLL